ncbi:hypothetical protein Taro_054997 [Colocasia esculenta]|uniref:Uncharacterized protein n=1 Tax=Colocasia esculenta TaxID=4460 RepID=A0A843XSB4_COLES|nr:hypothetical protein [Colocasia esculenta]
MRDVTSIVQLGMEADALEMEKSHCFYVCVDFGLAKKYRDTSTHQHIPYSETCITYREWASEAMNIASHVTVTG